MPNQERLQPQWIVPIKPEGIVLTGHELVLCEGRIEQILTSADAEIRYPEAPIKKLPGHVLMPGLINVHGHAAMTLLRGYADDHKLLTWLNDYIWPVEAKVVCPSFVETGAWLAATEMVQSGTTCAADSYFFPESTAAAFARVGLRSQITTPILAFPTAWAEKEDDYIRQSIDFFEWAEAQPRLTTGFAPHACYSVSNNGFEQVLRYSNDLEKPIHLHLHETKEEVTNHQAEWGYRPIARLVDLGLFNHRLQAVHMTDLTTDEITQSARNNVNIAHCPESNLKLASGIFPMEQVQAAGINVALGSDGAASNNDLDLFQELRTAALLAKGSSQDPTLMDAFSALEMATLKGAQFLGLDQEIGSLEIGKSADLIAVDLSDIRHQPVYHPVSHLAYTATGQDVTHTWIAGQLVFENRQHRTSDIPALSAQIDQWQQTIQGLA